MNVTKAIHNLYIYHGIFPFSEFTDKENACYRDDDPTVVNPLVSEVLTAMPKYGELHKVLSACVAGDLNIKWVTYDNLVKITARILAGIFTEPVVKQTYGGQPGLARRNQSRLERVLSSKQEKRFPVSIHREEYSLMRKSAVDENSHLHNIKYRIKGAAAAGCSFSVLRCSINGDLS